MKPSQILLSLALLSALPLAGSAAEIPGSFTRQTPSAGAPDLNQWWKNFHDPQLDKLMADALAGNPTLMSAAARVREARARRMATAGDYWPQLSAGAGGSRSLRSSNGQVDQFASNEFAFGVNPDPFNLFDVTLDASWEIDVFGRNRRLVEAASAQAAAAEEARRNVMISLLAEIASNYVELRGLQNQKAVLNDNLASQKKTLELTQSRLQAGLSPELVVAQAEAQLAITQALLPSVETGIAAAIHRIGSLTGQPAGTYVKHLAAAHPIPSGPSTIPAGLPSELLQRRPDVRQAERNFAAATAQAGAAKAARMPRISIGSSIGLRSTDTGTLMDRESEEWTVGPKVSIPLFTGGKLKQNQKAAEAVRDQAQADWDQAVLGAIEDVESALVAYRQIQNRLEALRKAEKASNRSYELANELYKNGLGDFLNVLEAQRTRLSAQEQVVIGQRQASLDLIKLYKALGGGWEDTSTPVKSSSK
jgi:multidrug efflux system outer membrane protein